MIGGEKRVENVENDVFNGGFLELMVLLWCIEEDVGRIDVEMERDEVVMRLEGKCCELLNELFCKKFFFFLELFWELLLKLLLKLFFVDDFDLLNCTKALGRFLTVVVVGERFGSVERCI
jgi:hypothetical protein